MDIQDQTRLNLIIGKLLLGVKIRAFDINWLAHP